MCKNADFTVTPVQQNLLGTSGYFPAHLGLVKCPIIITLSSFIVSLRSKTKDCWLFLGKIRVNDWRQLPDNENRAVQQG